MLIVADIVERCIQFLQIDNKPYTEYQSILTISLLCRNIPSLMTYVSQ